MAETESAPAAAEVPAVDPTQPPSKENELTYEFEVIISLYAILTIFFSGIQKPLLRKFLQNQRSKSF
jgi:hypothetical protein